MKLACVSLDIELVVDQIFKFSIEMGANRISVDLDFLTACKQT